MLFVGGVEEKCWIPRRLPVRWLAVASSRTDQADPDAGRRQDFPATPSSSVFFRFVDWPVNQLLSALSRTRALVAEGELQGDVSGCYRVLYSRDPTLP